DGYRTARSGAPMTRHQNTTIIAPRKPPESPGKAPSRRRHRASLPRPFSRREIDGRSSAAKLFDQLTGAIEADLGGADQFSAIDRHLVHAFAGAAVTLHHLNARLMAGEEINLAQHAQAVSAMVRVASRLGLQRRQKDVEPTLAQILAAEEALDAAEAEAQE